MLFIKRLTEKYWEQGQQVMKIHQELLKQTPYVGDTYTTTAEKFKGYQLGYQLTGIPSNATGAVTDSTQMVTYTYAPIQEKVNVQIIDDTTHQTIKTVILSTEATGKLYLKQRMISCKII